MPDIVLTGHIADAGAYQIYLKNKETLETHFSRSFLSVVPERKQGEPNSFRVEALWSKELSIGGLYEGLWQLSKEFGCGFEVDLDKIPIHQETVEIYEYYRENPYTGYSKGNRLYLMEHGEELKEKLKEQGVFSEVIGKTKKGSGKIVIRKGSVCHVERPRVRM